MNTLVNATILTLEKSKNILQRLTDEQLSNSSIPPYYSCVGTHIRHILDFYKSITAGVENGFVDLTDRLRNTAVESNCQVAYNEVDLVLTDLKRLYHLDASDLITVQDDLGQGLEKIDYTLGSLIAQANSHTIHHYAIINYLLNSLGININDETLGVNPTTPKPDINLN